MKDRLTILCGDAVEQLQRLPDASVQCCVTSPPYFGLRNYSAGDQEIGQEKTPDEYIARLVEVFGEVRRALKPDGTLWLNLGDSFNASPGQRKVTDKAGPKQQTNGASSRAPSRSVRSLKPKDLIGIPWMAAFALRADGWWLRSDIVWAKQNCIPESVTDRPTRSHEFIFLLTKSARYFYDAEAIKEPCIYDVDETGTAARKARADGNNLVPTEKVNGIRAGGFKDAQKFNGKNGYKQRGHSRRHQGFNDRWDDMEKAGQCTGMRNKRDVWTVAPSNYPEAHFGTFPPKLIEPCVLAGSRSGDIILDPFAGSGTTGRVAIEHGRKAVLIELNPAYIPLIESRTNVTPGFEFA